MNRKENERREEKIDFAELMTTTELCPSGSNIHKVLACKMFGSLKIKHTELLVCPSNCFIRFFNEPKIANQNNIRNVMWETLNHWAESELKLGKFQDQSSQTNDFLRTALVPNQENFLKCYRLPSFG